MRPGPSLLLIALLLSPYHASAEQSPPQPAVTPPSPQADIAPPAPQPQPVADVQLPATPVTQSQADDGERDSVQLQRLRQENQRLKLRLKEALAAAPERLVSEQQLWFAIGAGASLLGVIIGALLRGGRRSRREWLN
ncbi:translation initiation factor 2 [Pseudomonas borbori]